MKEADGYEHIEFDPDHMMCARHRRLLRAAAEYNADKGHRTQLLIVKALMLSAEFADLQGKTDDGLIRVDDAQEAIRALSPICCTLGEHRMALVAHRSGLKPCRYCLWRDRHHRRRFATTICAVCTNHRWTPRQ